MSLPDPIIGKKLGDYTIRSLLGRGGMARVYKGYDERLDRYAAVKVITSDFVATADETEYKDRFETRGKSYCSATPCQYRWCLPVWRY